MVSRGETAVGLPVGLVVTATGTGHTAFALTPRVARVVGTDFTPEMLAESERLAREQAAVALGRPKVAPPPSV